MANTVAVATLTTTTIKKSDQLEGDLSVCKIKPEKYNPINLNGAVIALCGLAMFSLTQDDSETDWNTLRYNSSAASMLIFMLFGALLVIFASILSKKWRTSKTKTLLTWSPKDSPSNVLPVTYRSLKLHIREADLV